VNGISASCVLSGIADLFVFFFQAEDGIRDKLVTGVQTCALPISAGPARTRPGVFELGPLAARVARKGGIDGIVAVGCLIRGGTDHYRVLCDEVTRALGALAMEGGTNPRALAVAFGVLTCETLQQAQERADPRGAD